jgi:hypothetical protein
MHSRDRAYDLLQRAATDCQWRAAKVFSVLVKAVENGVPRLPFPLLQQLKPGYILGVEHHDLSV